MCAIVMYFSHPIILLVALASHSKAVIVCALHTTTHPRTPIYVLCIFLALDHIHADTNMHAHTRLTHAPSVSRSIFIWIFYQFFEWILNQIKNRLLFHFDLPFIVLNVIFMNFHSHVFVRSFVVVVFSP